MWRIKSNDTAESFVDDLKNQLEAKDHTFSALQNDLRKVTNDGKSQLEKVWIK